MTKELWLNLPVENLQRSKDFFTALGFTFSPLHENNPEMAALQVGEKKTIVMLFVKPLFGHIVQHEVADAAKASEVMISFDAESREEVDQLAEKVTQAGGNLFAPPAEVQGWMYGCAFADPDGHRWNILYMDPEHMPH